MRTMWLPKYGAWVIAPLAIVVCSGTLVEAQNTTTRVSVATGGHRPTGGGAARKSVADVSDDGRYVAFTSTATNLVAGDTNGFQDIFVHDRQTGVDHTRRASGRVASRPTGCSAGQSISGDGRFVVVSVSGDEPGSGRPERARRPLRPRQADWRRAARQRGDRWCTGDGWQQLHHGHQREWSIRGVLLQRDGSGRRRYQRPAGRLPPRSPDGHDDSSQRGDWGAQSVGQGSFGPFISSRLAIRQVAIRK